MKLETLISFIKRRHKKSLSFFADCWNKLTKSSSSRNSVKKKMILTKKRMKLYVTEDCVNNHNIMYFNNQPE